MTQKRLFRVPLFLMLLLPACQQEMAKQPSYRKVLQESEFFSNGRSARPIPAGTMARGLPRDDAPLLRVTKSDLAIPVAGGLLMGGPGAVVAASGKPLRPEDYVNTFPFPIDEAALKRGQERYTIFCAICHGANGRGGGKIVKRGYLRPPNYAIDDSRGFERRGIKVLLRDAPVGYFFEVVSQGFGGMPDYAAQVPPADRWKIIAYVRVLQLSGYARLDDLPAEERRAALKALEGNP
jgi:mono/diheme cytochrome c family protein